ncbi:MAG: hypothetical protein FVQ84_08600 [Planctomycetes bacterium]|nr:hypothetical protein [Planctomycetota bacterium]
MAGDNNTNRIIEMASEIGTLKGLLEGQGKDLRDIKKSKSDMWKKINWANAKINLAIGAWTAVAFIIGLVFAILGVIR